jgi:protein TonB
VSFRVTVDAEGAAKDCAVLDATQPPTIGPFTCDLIKQRARFTPARDKAGNPAADFYINSVFWKFSG